LSRPALYPPAWSLARSADDAHPERARVFMDITIGNARPERVCFELVSSYSSRIVALCVY
jgi:hypothetical protein